MKNKVINISSLTRRPSVRKIDAEAEKLINGFKHLSRREKETLLTLLDAFLLHKRSIDGSGAEC